MAMSFWRTVNSRGSQFNTSTTKKIVPRKITAKDVEIRRLLLSSLCPIATLATRIALILSPRSKDSRNP
jgi:hypothetical protein